MVRRSRVFRHLFLDVAQHPNLIFRSFMKVLERSRVNVTHILRQQAEWAGREAFAIPFEHTIFVSPDDYSALAAAGEERVVADLAEQFKQFLKTPAGRVYDTPYLEGVSFALALDTQLGLERNEYYFAWLRNPLVGVVGRLDLVVRGERVESFDVPAVPALGLGTTRQEQIRLDRLTDGEVHLPRGLSLWVTHEGGSLTLLNRSPADARVLVDTVVLPPDQAFPLRDGSRIAVGPDVCLSFAAEGPGAEGVHAVRQPMRKDIEEVLGLLGLEAEGGAWGEQAVSGPAAAGATSPAPRPSSPTEAAPRTGLRRRRGPAGQAPALGRLEVVGSVITTQMFEYVPGRLLCLGSSPRCHIVVRGPGVRPVHAELALGDGGLYLGNRSGRRAVHCGPLEAPVPPGARHPLTLGDPIRLAAVRLHLEPPFKPIAEDIASFFGANYLGNLIFSEPQERLVIDPSERPLITIGRDQACDWTLASPYLWPSHAQVLSRESPSIRPLPDLVRGRGPALFVNMMTVLEGGQSHALRRGDHIVIGNLIVRYAL